jgi:subtilisin family serine protease
VARRRRIEDLTAESQQPSSILGDGDSAIPGEVIFALEPDAAAQMAVSLPTVPARGAAVAAAAGGVESLGVAAVDKALTRTKLTSITRVHGPSPASVIAGVATASDLGLDTTLRARFDGTESAETVAKRLNGLNEVAWAEPNRWRETTVVPNDPKYPAQWGLARIGCPDAWDLTTGDPSIVVAVVDTGVDLNHPELSPLLVAGQDLVDFPAGATPQPGWVFEGDFTGVDATPQDEVGHGTHVAGTICCLSDNGVGVAGVSWNVRLMPVRVLARVRNLATNQVSGIGSSANIAAGIRWAADNGARVINMSLGGSGDARVEREAVAYAISKGVVVVAAMGNDASAAPSYPGAYPSVIGVGATDSSDRRASFSNTGAWIDVAAPGVGIQSTYWDDTYTSLSGTSMATPHVAGVAALILSRNPALTAAQVGDLIRGTAKPLRSDPADPVPNDEYGHGLVQAGEAVKAAAPAPVPIPSTMTHPCPPPPPPTRVFVRCPSVIVRCPPPDVIGRLQRTSPWVLCPPSTNPKVFCVPTVRSPWCPPSEPFWTCPPRSKAFPCVSFPVCPSLPPGCPPNSGFICPSGPVCGDPGLDPGQRLTEAEATDWEGYDPYGYDPYGSGYE